MLSLINRYLIVGFPSSNISYVMINVGVNNLEEPEVIVAFKGKVYSYRTIPSGGTFDISDLVQSFFTEFTPKAGGLCTMIGKSTDSTTLITPASVNTHEASLGKWVVQEIKKNPYLEVTDTQESKALDDAWKSEFSDIQFLESTNGQLSDSNSLSHLINHLSEGNAGKVSEKGSVCFTDVMPDDYAASLNSHDTYVYHLRRGQGYDAFLVCEGGGTIGDSGDILVVTDNGDTSLIRLWVDKGE